MPSQSELAALTESYVKRLRDKLPTRVFRNIEARGLDECWNWKLSKNAQGYGQVQIGTHSNSKTGRVHVMVYEAVYGPITKPVVMHSCDNRGCVNPRHLSNGTHAENSADAAAKGRMGPKTPRMKITREQAREIRASKEDAKEVAKRYGISRGHVYHLRNGWSSRGV